MPLLALVAFLGSGGEDVTASERWVSVGIALAAVGALILAGLIYEAFCFRGKLVKALPLGRDDYFLLRHVFLSNSREQNRRCERCTMSNSIRWR